MIKTYQNYSQMSPWPGYWGFGRGHPVAASAAGVIYSSLVLSYCNPLALAMALEDDFPVSIAKSGERFFGREVCGREVIVKCFEALLEGIAVALVVPSWIGEVIWARAAANEMTFYLASYTAGSQFGG